MRAHVSTPLPRVGFFFSGFEPRRHGLLGQTDDDAVGHAQIDGDDVLVEDPLLALEPDEARHRLGRPALRQPDVDAVVDLQGPAARRDQRSGQDAPAQRAGRLEQRQVVGRVEVGVLADDERQMREAPILEGVDDGAVLGDHGDFAVALP